MIHRNWCPILCSGHPTVEIYQWSVRLCFLCTFSSDVQQNDTTCLRSLSTLSWPTWVLKSVSINTIWLFTVSELSKYNCNIEPGYRSRYNGWLRARRPRGRSSSPSTVKNFLFSTSSRPALASTQPPIQWVPGTLSPGIKRPGREADHSPPASAEVKKIWIYTSTPPYAFMA
jgi:hypothetical protein